MEASLYENDFYRWTIEQSKKLRCGNFEGLDLQNLADEIESLGRQEKRELENRLGVLIGHLLKWQYQQEKRTRSWQITINTQRRAINKLLKDNSSLKSYLKMALEEGFVSGLDLVLTETPLKKKELPSLCPYTIEQIFDSSFPVDIETEFE
ncbi:DUF29 domain-containing protein [Anabaena sp. UHCC 0451]|uniref:DUF29 domain-containing protein n=1 Tax=Anabaena sp. UHCC 0451 TaxID=2055235 RepID=UPI002B1FB787|nr:DUF29 domain-containing protein [Anabaena sp. UHCC 0451]MEA5575297.1 DUF29 domain-containing protein [Anabaena sp. UHCC 0451]